ncbi:hypothetical protein SAMN06265222_110153 [Neorhodopirellula lusitana]|uniref:Uncharacterized protein n=1 Tax=Neorhodopirellula lusitana TaxID=445327 RepID=A0ABY1QCJ5_9BACT|nr:hypothetical protein SAMN06265222_110153 [Neorhodopirellula lusitana]
METLGRDGHWRGEDRERTVASVFPTTTVHVFSQCNSAGLFCWSIPWVYSPGLSDSGLSDSGLSGSVVVVLTTSCFDFTQAAAS